uniref:Uncharacterized protein n=1 Tax=Sphaerodactylus townsendi TaxID=933632 RepID=A0ACB8EFZ1_9SAUR
MGSPGLPCNSPPSATELCQQPPRSTPTVRTSRAYIPGPSSSGIRRQAPLGTCLEVMGLGFLHTHGSMMPGKRLWRLHLYATRVLTELVSKMRDMRMDKTELGCLRAIILFNPDAKGLSNPGDVELLREKVYASLESYCKQKYPEQQGRFAKLLLRLPALRSIGLKCLEHLFFFKLIGDTPIDTFLMEMLEAPHQLS